MRKFLWRVALLLALLFCSAALGWYIHSIIWPGPLSGTF